MVVKTAERKAEDETLRIKVDGACYTFRIEEFGEADLNKIKVYIHQTLLAMNDQREYLWHKLRQINEELDRRVNEQAAGITHPLPLPRGD